MAKICGNINPSKFNELVSIEVQTLTDDNYGGQTKTWATLSGASALWASIEPISAWEKYQAQKMEVPITHKMMMRYFSTITPAMRVKFGTRIFEICEVINIEEANSYLKIMAVEGTAT